MTVFLIVLALVVFVVLFVAMILGLCRHAALGDRVAITPPDSWDGWPS